jgi:hypothetical protein
MTQHPVPQNVIEVEFKLFGSFTLKQFSKMLIGAIVGTVIFLLPLPGIIKYPIAAASVLTGLGMAITPALGTWLTGFVKAMFVSPRYVWIREVSPPDILKAKEISTTTTSKEFKVNAAKKTNKIDIEKLDLRQIYGNDRSNLAQSVIQTQSVTNNSIDLKPDKTSEDNFVRVYEDVFGEGIFSKAKDSALDNLYKQEFVEKPKEDISQENRVQNYKREIENLKYSLSMLEKNSEYKHKEEEILSRINDIYREIKVLEDPHLNIGHVAPVIKNQSLQQSIAQGKIINGIVVDKQDRPIASAMVSFVNKEKNVIYRTKSSTDGKFTTGTPIPNGKYAVVIDDSTHKFHTYLVEVDNQNLPAFKFREK